MKNEKFKSTLNQADQLLEVAQNELFRSADDVVPHMVCSSARQSIYNYLQGFLLGHNIDQKENISLEALLEKCQQIEPKFRTFDLSKMACRTATSDKEFCTELRTVEHCVDLAAHAKKLVEESETSHWPESRHIK